MENVELKLNIEEVNTILTALGQQPYIQVFHLIASIQQQVTEQLASEKKK